jgi:hypothetical protein
VVLRVHAVTGRPLRGGQTVSASAALLDPSLWSRLGGVTAISLTLSGLSRQTMDARPASGG